MRDRALLGRVHKGVVMAQILFALLGTFLTVVWGQWFNRLHDNPLDGPMDGLLIGLWLSGQFAILLIAVALGRAYG